jgi:hypothetical protein
MSDDGPQLPQLDHGLSLPSISQPGWLDTRQAVVMRKSSLSNLFLSSFLFRKLVEQEMHFKI